MQLQITDYRKSYLGAIHRPVGPCETYNCHGLTFAARRTRIWQSAEITKILKDDDYEEVRRDGVLAGDIAVYYEARTGDAEHSGVVVSNELVHGPRILSKWGSAHEVVHYLGQCPFDASNVKFYRVTT